ncbi:hypothetical protein YC2023_033421 [Brassica napus]
MTLRKHQKHPENPFLIFFRCLNFPQPVSGSKRLNLNPENCAVYSPPIMFSRAFRNSAIGNCYRRRSSSRFKSDEVFKFRLVLG